MKEIIEFERLNISDCGLSEDNIQEMLAKNPAILGLGDLTLVDREKRQQSGGRIDLLLKDTETDNKRYEVEIQLKATDPSHIVRTIEYWDLERKRYPQYEHCAVIVAEDITSRFFNVISLFNGFIPIIAIQMNAYRQKGTNSTGLIFTKILDQSNLIGIGEESKPQELVDRKFWESKGYATLQYVDQLLTLFNEGKPPKEQYELNYTRPYIGLKRERQSTNVIVFEPQKQLLLLKYKLAQEKENDDIIENAGFASTLAYDSSFRNYRIKLSENDIKTQEKKEVLKKLFEKAENEYFN